MGASVAFGAGAGADHAAPDNGDAFEAGESDGPDDEGPEEMEAAGFDIPEPLERDDLREAPEAAETSAFAPEQPEERRRDKSDSAPGETEELRRDTPDSDDNLQ